MIKLFKKFGGKSLFNPAKLEESVISLANPCRGWFDIRIFNIETEPSFDDMSDALPSDKLILLMIDIGAFRDKRLGDMEISRLEKILTFYHGHGKDIILRISYDATGKGMEREPSTFDKVLIHAEQISEFVGKQADKIFIYQGLLIGKWGEMHTTKFLSQEKLRELNVIFEEKIGKNVYRAVRKPVQWRLMNPWGSSINNVETRGLGIFNDGMFGSESDLGTYDPLCKNTKLWCSPWNRDNETLFISKIAEEVPYGGEALFGESFAASHDTKDYINELQKLNVTYLNRNHDRKIIEHWKRELYTGNDIWNKHSCFDYIGAHLGYRFVIKNARIFKKKKEKYIEIIIENTGFANLYTDTELLLRIKNESIVTEKVFTQRLNLCKAGNSREYIEKLDLIPGKYYLSAKTIKENISILFANNMLDIDGSVFIGEVKNT